MDYKIIEDENRQSNSYLNRNNRTIDENDDDDDDDE